MIHNPRLAGRVIKQRCDLLGRVVIRPPASKSESKQQSEHQHDQPSASAAVLLLRRLWLWCRRLGWLVICRSKARLPQKSVSWPRASTRVGLVGRIVDPPLHHVGIMGSTNASVIRDSNMADHDPPYRPASCPPYELGVSHERTLRKLQKRISRAV